MVCFSVSQSMTLEIREGGDDVDEREGGGDGDLADPEVEQR